MPVKLFCHGYFESERAKTRYIVSYTFRSCRVCVLLSFFAVSGNTCIYRPTFCNIHIWPSTSKMLKTTLLLLISLGVANAWYSRVYEAELYEHLRLGSDDLIGCFAKEGFADEVPEELRYPYTGGVLFEECVIKCTVEVRFIFVILSNIEIQVYIYCPDVGSAFPLFTPR